MSESTGGWDGCRNVDWTITFKVSVMDNNSRTSALYKRIYNQE